MEVWKITTKTLRNFLQNICRSSFSSFMPKLLFVLFIVKTWNFTERDFNKDFTLQKSSILKCIQICGALCNLVPFVQFKEREKQPWRSVNFSKVAGFKPANLLKLTLLHGCFSWFLNSTNGTKSRNASHVMIETSKLHQLRQYWGLYCQIWKCFRLLR